MVNLKSINLSSKYWVEMKFWIKSRIITLLQIDENQCTINLDFVNTNACYANFGQNPSIVLKILSGNEILR